MDETTGIRFRRRTIQNLECADRARYHLAEVEALAIVETVLEHEKMRGIKLDASGAAMKLLAQELKGVGTRL